MKLNQVIAVEKGVRAESMKVMTKEYHDFQKADLFSGMNKTYTPSKEGGLEYPSESVQVRKTVEDSLKVISNAWKEMVNQAATKDSGNLHATADVVIDGQTLLVAVPATHLLFLEKQLNDLHTAFDAIPVLDPTQHWIFDEASATYRSSEKESYKTKKVQKPIVMYDATPEHPAQTQLISEDVVVGRWSTQYLSGAMTERHKQDLLGKLARLRIAVKMAREEANSVTIDRQDSGTIIAEWLF